MNARHVLVAIACALLVMLPLACRRGAEPSAATDAGRPPRTHPDYPGTIFPPNIAPPNFVVDESARRTVTRISGAAGEPITVRGKGACVSIPPAPWRALLEANRGGEVSFEVSARAPDGSWRRYEPFTAGVAREEVDRYLAFRVIDPAFNLWDEVEIRERDLTTYRERAIVRGPRIDSACVNCHTFRAGSTDVMLASTRSQTVGSAAVLVEKGQATRLDTKMGYSAVSPDGRTIAYSLNNVRQFFHAARSEARDVLDLDSDLALLDVATRTVTTRPPLAEEDRLETYPTWAPDGRALYFCSAPRLWERNPPFPPEGWNRVRYDLRRVSYDPTDGTVGESETVLSAEAARGSILLPRLSPDGRFVLFTLCEYGCFPAFQPSADLCLLELRTGEWRRLDINTEQSESWHSWSSNGRWIAFSSKRDDGVHTRTYLACVDPEGGFAKPFAVPQEDPERDRAWLKTRSVPELLTEPVPAAPEVLEAAARSTEKVQVTLPDMSMTRKASVPPPSDTGQGERE